MPGAVLAIDAGTTGVTVLTVGEDGRVLSRGYREFPQHYPKPGWVEHDAEEIWEATLAAAADALRGSGVDPVAIGITNQRETFLFWDRRTGRPLHNAIVWQCRRSAAICEELKAAGLEAEVRRKTGLLLDPYFSGTKTLWLAREQPEVARMVSAGDAAFGTIDSWLAYRLSGGVLHVTDVTNAARTLAFDIDRFDWDDALLDAFALTRAAMPEVRPSAGVRGETVACGAIAAGVPIAAQAGDQQAALFGQACFQAGQAKATYGTGCFILLNTGRRVDSSGGLLSTPTASGDGRPVYALEGSIFVAGAAVQWCRDNLGLIRDLGEAEALATSVPDSGGVVFVPAFVGLGTPYWGPDARGAIFGLTRGTRPAHIVRAALESMAYQAQDVLDIMAEEAGVAVRELRVDGGAAGNDFLMQLQADLCGAVLSRPESVESTGLGAAYLAGIAVGLWKDEAEVAALRREERRFTPSARAAARRGERGRWSAAVEGLLATRLPPFEGLE
ncbi:MAG TPA: glycerol kinase GlpK [Dehalococcoidia bacterium]|nr:glycerol kinase GlpK [Dehalococcoidia bacterium]